jgi:hypothetical protein
LTSKLWFLLMIVGAAFLVTGTYALLAQSPEPAQKGEVQGTGTVRYLSFEGGFWGIVSDDGMHYDVGSLPQEFQIDGLRVRFSLNIKHDAISFHMWGQIAQLVSIERL